jgi:small subunit ribosomal protein S3Ae
LAEKKKWYEVLAPKMFDEKPVAETLAAEPEQLIGRKFEISLMNLSKDYSRFFVKLIFQIERVEGEKAYTKFAGHDVMRDRIYRMVQRRVRRVDVIQDVTTKDGTNVRVKTVLTMSRRVNTSLKHEARRIAYNYMIHVAEKLGFDDFMKIIIKGDLQKAIRKECSHIYPVTEVEIRKTELVSGEKKALHKESNEQKKVKEKKKVKKQLEKTAKKEEKSEEAQ